MSESGGTDRPVRQGSSNRAGPPEVTGISGGRDLKYNAAIQAISMLLL